MANPSEVPMPTLLHVFLLTYNRAGTFRRTLEQIAASPLRTVPVTVMDNCSTDETGAVCEEYRALLPMMEVQRHPKNIGFGANYLRSIELSRGRYTWVMCDDDTLFPDRVETLLELLGSQGPEACFVGGPQQDVWPGGTDLKPAELDEKFGTFLTVQSFVPGVVFKTALIGSAELLAGYFGIRTNFPQLTVGRKLLVENIPCAVLQPPVLQREDPNEKGSGYLDVAAGWSDFCRSLPAEMRLRTFYSFFGTPTMKKMLTEVLRMVLWSKIEGNADPGYHISRIAVNMGGEVRAALVLTKLACLVPGSVYNAAREGYRKVKYGWLGRPLPATYHVPVCRDELRR